MQLLGHLPDLAECTDDLAWCNRVVRHLRNVHGTMFQREGLPKTKQTPKDIMIWILWSSMVKIEPMERRSAIYLLRWAQMAVDSYSCGIQCPSALMGDDQFFLAVKEEVEQKQLAQQENDSPADIGRGQGTLKSAAGTSADGQDHEAQPQASRLSAEEECHERPKEYVQRAPLQLNAAPQQRIQDNGDALGSSEAETDIECGDQGTAQSRPTRDSRPESITGAQEIDRDDEKALKPSNDKTEVEHSEQGAVRPRPTQDSRPELEPSFQAKRQKTS